MLLIGLPIYGTGQVMDNIIFQKQTYPLIGYPLLQYPDQSCVRPDSMFKGQGCWNTADYRRYIATWLIEGDSLFLLKIANDCFGLNQAGSIEYADLSKLFPTEYVSGKVFADWFSGLIYCAYGKVLFWGNDLATFEREIELNIQKGRLIGNKILDNTKSRQVNYEKLFTSSYTRNDGFREHLDSLINWEILPPVPNGKARTTITFSANEDGVIDDIRVVRGCGEMFDKEAVRIVRTFPANVQFYHGKLMRYYYTMPIVFNESTRLSKISKK